MTFDLQGWSPEYLLSYYVAGAACAMKQTDLIVDLFTMTCWSLAHVRFLSTMSLNLSVLFGWGHEQASRIAGGCAMLSVVSVCPTFAFLPGFGIGRCFNSAIGRPRLSRLRSTRWLIRLSQAEIFFQLISSYHTIQVCQEKNEKKWKKISCYKINNLCYFPQGDPRYIASFLSFNSWIYVKFLYWRRKILTKISA